MLKARTLLGVLMATLAVVGTAAVAGPFEDAVVAHERGDYATAMRLSRPLAEQGDPRAQLMLGILLDDGPVVRAFPTTLQRRSVGFAGRPIRVMQELNRASGACIN
jgi:hypothetical protein